MQIILLYSGNPLPAMLELGFVATERGVEVHLVLIDRAVNDLALDRTLVNYSVTGISSPYNGLDVKRFLFFPVTACRIIFRILKIARPRCVVITSTLDMLLVARVVGIFRTVKIRHQVRDLHPLQLGDGLASRMVRTLERLLLKRCELLVYSAPAFYEEYYRALYDGPVVLLENLPKKVVWQGFQRRERAMDSFVVGYIGIIRYMNPLLNLVDAVEQLAATGVNGCVRFAGGGDTTEIRKRIKLPDRFSFQGKFEYSSAVAGLYAGVDVIFAVYDRFDRNCQLAMPTKYYESILTGIPILVSKDTYIGRLVESEGIGCAVDGESAADIARALAQIGQPGSWYEVARQKLADIDLVNLYTRYAEAVTCAIAPEVEAQ